MMCKWCDGVSSRSLTIHGQWWFRFPLLVFSIWITFAEAKCDFRWQFVAPNRYRQAAAAEAKELSSDHILPSSDAVFIISKMLARRFCAHWNRRIKHTYTHFVISWQLQLLRIRCCRCERFHMRWMQIFFIFLLLLSLIWFPPIELN